MADGLDRPPITQREFIGDDFEIAERIAARLGYAQTVYTSTSALWGLYCLRENPERARTTVERRHPPYVAGCIIKTQELGFLFVQDLEDLGLTATHYQTAEHCQYCGNSWQQTRTIGTPRLDAVPCPKCQRLV